MEKENMALAGVLGVIVIVFLITLYFNNDNKISNLLEEASHFKFVDFISAEYSLSTYLSIALLAVQSLYIGKLASELWKLEEAMSQKYVQ